MTWLRIQPYMTSRPTIAIGLSLLTCIGCSSRCLALDTYHIYPEWRRYSVKFVEPTYPVLVYRKGIQGTGVFRLTIDPKSGAVTEVKVVKTTGHAILNELAAKAFLQCKFVPGMPRQIEVKYGFEISGYGRELH